MQSKHRNQIHTKLRQAAWINCKTFNFWSIYQLGECDCSPIGASHWSGNTQKFNQKNPNGKKFVKWNIEKNEFFWPVAKQRHGILFFDDIVSAILLHKSSTTSMKFVWLRAANRKIAIAFTGDCVEAGKIAAPQLAQYLHFIQPSSARVESSSLLCENCWSISDKCTLSSTFFGVVFSHGAATRVRRNGRQ